MKLTVETRNYTNGMVEALVFDGKNEVARLAVRPKSKDGSYQTEISVRVPTAPGEGLMFNVSEMISRLSEPEVPARPARPSATATPKEGEPADALRTKLAAAPDVAGASEPDAGATSAATE